MPAVGETGRRIVVKPKAKKKPTVIRPPDRQPAPKPPTPDQADRNRSPAQKARDTKAVAESVRSSRVKALQKRNRGSGTRAIKRFPGEVIERAYGPGSANRNAIVNRGEAKRLRAKGVPVRTLTKSESRDIGATVGVKTIGTAGPVRAAQATGIGLAMHPKTSLPATAKGGRDALAGILPGLAKLGVETLEGAKKGHPERGVVNVAKETKKDVERRYGGINKPGGVTKMAERVSKEGAAPELLDASTLIGGVAGPAGRGLSTLAKAEKLGKTARRVATVRPKLRISGGEAKTQPVHRNLVIAAGQAAQDVAREKAHARRVRKAKAKARPLGAVDVEVKPGEVTPLRVRAPLLKPKAERLAKREAAGRKGRYHVLRQRETQQEVGRGTSRNIASLSKLERIALTYAVKFGIRDPARAVEVLTAHRARVVAERERTGKTVPAHHRETHENVKDIDKLLAKPEAFTGRVGQVADVERRRGKRVAMGDPALSGERVALRTYAQQAEHLGVERIEGETARAFVSRVRQAAKKEGLADPGYFKSVKRPTARFSQYATGGTRAVADDKRYTGVLHREGREDIRPEAGLSHAFAQNIKRKWNWNLVADNVETHAFDWSKGKTANQILDHMDEHGIDPNSVALWNPRLFRREAKNAPEGERTAGEEPVQEGLDQGVDTAAVTFKRNDSGGWDPHGLSTSPEQFAEAGWRVIPKAVYDEIHADTRPSGKIGRGYDIIKGKQSRLLLGTSPAWLQFQVASNAILAGLAGTGARDMIKAQLWWNGLTDAEKSAVEPYIGVSAFRDTHQQTKMGAAATGDIANAYRALKQTPFFHKPRKVLRGGNVTDLNPLDTLFRADAIQNNFFRKSVLYKQVKKDAYQRMGRDVGQMQRIQGQFLDTITNLGPKEQMRAVIRDQDALERHAKHVNDFLGDYMTYTAKERRVFARSAMFYGYLRFSLRFALWTMPTRHPVVSSILAQMGRMETDEVRKLLGGDALPYQLGKVYFEKDGKLKSVNVGRANPTMNAAIDMLSDLPDPRKVVGFLPPIAQSILNQFASRNIGFGRDYRVRGKEDTSAWEGKPGMQTVDRGRILASDMLGMIAPYREFEKAGTKGVPLGDDSLLWDPRPTKFKDRDVQLGVQRQATQDKRGTGRRVAEATLLPFIPQPDRAREQATLATARKALRAVAKKIEETPLKDRTRPEISWKGGGFYTKGFQALLDEQKKQREVVDRLQAAGAPAPSPPRLQRRPLTPREAVEKKREQVRSRSPREEAEKTVGRIRARQTIIRGGG